MPDDKNARVVQRAIELFGTLMGQEISKSPITPVDTGLMRSSFAQNIAIIQEGGRTVVRYTVPKYAEYVNNGTKRIKARHFIQKIFHQNGERILKQSFRIASKQVQ